MHRGEWALTPAAPLVKASEIDRNHSKDAYQTKQEVIGNSWIILFAGHESTGNTTHFALTFLAIALESQARLQAGIDNVLSSRPVEDWSYETDMSRLYQSMVGAVMNETLRLCPPIIDIPQSRARDRKDFELGQKSGHGPSEYNNSSQRLERWPKPEILAK